MLKNCLLKLHECGAIQFGEFKLKSGILSPVYIDFRLIVSYPKLLTQIADLIWQKIAQDPFELFCGVPYTALPIATALSLKHNVPMVMRRKEVKEYGTKKAIEGAFKEGDRCILIEDIITSGASIFETIAPLEEQKVRICKVVVILDREQGGRKKVEQKGYSLQALMTMTDLLTLLLEEKKITPQLADRVRKFIFENQIL